MKINEALKQLERAHENNRYPQVIYNFKDVKEKKFSNARIFEESVRSMLLSENIEEVKDGLSNILYWGYYRMGIRHNRVTRFRKEISTRELVAAKSVLRKLEGAGLREIANVGLPQFSMMPFVSKIRMFLAPSSYVVLDNKLAKLSKASNFFSSLVKRENATTIRITADNVIFYQQWCQLCVRTAARMDDKQWIAVDVERAIFCLVDHGDIKAAGAVVDAIYGEN